MMTDPGGFPNLVSEPINLSGTRLLMAFENDSFDGSIS